jgi:hypothetical protein
MPFRPQMFQPPSVIIMSIAATRMYRSLAGFVYGFTEAYGILLVFLSPRLVLPMYT